MPHQFEKGELSRYRMLSVYARPDEKGGDVLTRVPLGMIAAMYGRGDWDSFGRLVRATSASSIVSFLGAPM